MADRKKQPEFGYIWDRDFITMVSDIRKMHQEVFDFLYKWSKDEQRKGDAVNPFFLLRSPKDPRFADGYWFPGDEEKLYVTFWSGGDSIMKTPNVYLEIVPSDFNSYIVTSSDSSQKTKYFVDQIDQLSDWSKGGSIQEILDRTSSHIIKIQLTGNLTEALSWILRSIKSRLDNYILQNPPPAFEDFVSPFGFINAADFDNSVTAVLKLTKRGEEVSQSRGSFFEPSSDENDILPLSLDDVIIQNYQDIRNVNVSGLPHNAQWIFLTGENGFGKTSILQAIALGVYQPRDTNWNPPEKAFIEVQFKDQQAHHLQIHTRRGGALKITDLSLPLFCIGYGPARLIASGKDASVQSEESNFADTCSGLFSPETLLLSPERLLFNTSKVEESVFDSLRIVLQKVSNGRIHDIEVQGYDVLFREALPNGEVLEPVLLKYLAAGLRSTVNLVLDIFARLRKANGHPYPERFRGIVLIDELENHLHPVLQRELPGTLSKVFPLVQFIASTHSPIPLLGAPQGSVILTVHRDREQGITIERVDEVVDFGNMLPNAILTSPIFGLKNIIPDARSGEEPLRIEDNYSEVKENDRIQAELEKFLTPETKEQFLKLIRK